MRHDERGMALGIVLMASIVFSIAAYGVLTMAVSRAQQEDFLGDRRIRAHMAAEAGLVYAMQKLWADPNYPNPCCGGGCSGSTKTDTWPLDTDGVGGTDTTIDISVANCGAGNTHTLSAQVVY